MPSGKQISFENGEISPSLRFRTSLASYSTGLSSLLNKTVRKAGGVSNRAGFELVSIPNFQAPDSLKVNGRLRIFGATLPDNDNQDLENEIPTLFLIPSENTEAVEVFSSGIFNNIIGNSDGKALENVKMAQIGGQLIFSNGNEHWSYIREGSDIKYKIMLGPTATYPNLMPNTLGTAVGYRTSDLNLIADRPVMYEVFQVFRSGEEVLYARFDIYNIRGGGGPGAITGNPIEPQRHSGGSSYVYLNLSLSADPEVKGYHIFRSGRPEAVAHPSNWGIVGKVLTPAVDSNIVFTDYISTPDLTFVPSNEKYLYGDFVPSGLGMPALGLALGVPAADHYRELVSARVIGHYQQRRYIVVNSNNSKLDEGSVVVSKLGVPDQLDTGVIFSIRDAFDFTIPIGSKQRVVAMMELERLILLTSESVILVQGDENGTITPQTVNPTVISHVGCSERVTPVYVGNSGFFLSKNDERLMNVTFDFDGSARIQELSVLSDHLLEKSKIKEMALTRGKEDTLWLLNDDGKLRSVTIHEGGETVGWARHETDGFIESISSVKEKRPLPLNFLQQQSEEHDALYISVIREDSRVSSAWAAPTAYLFNDLVNYLGIEYRRIVAGTTAGTPLADTANWTNFDGFTRQLEKLSFREDSEVGQYAYVDSHMTFGSRLIFFEQPGIIGGYRKTVDLITGSEVDYHIGRTAFHGATTATSSVEMNIGDGLNPATEALWDVDQDINLKNLGLGNFQAIATEIQRIDFFYDELADLSDPDSEIITKQIRWTQTGFTDANNAVGRFDGVVPAALRDVTAQVGVSASDKNTIQTRWIRVKNMITGLNHLANQEVSVFADGVVLSSPNNPSYPTLTVDASGELELDDYYGWGVVGLPYSSEAETLNLDTSDERTFTDSRKLINKVGIALHESKGGYIGQTGSGTDLQKMEELISRENETLEESTKNINEHISLLIPGQWEPTGRVLVKQVDPLPMTILAIYPKGLAGE